MDSHARENVVDLVKASIAGVMASMSMVSAEALIAALTIVYLLALLLEKAYKFLKWLKERRANGGS